MPRISALIRRNAFLIAAGLIFLLIFSALTAWMYFIWAPYHDDKSNMIWQMTLNVLAGAALTAVLTGFIVAFNAQQEETKEKKGKIFEKKLEMYEGYLEKLKSIVIPGSDNSSEASPNLKNDEAGKFGALLFQLSTLNLHTQPDRTLRIYKHTIEVIQKYARYLSEENPNEERHALFNDVSIALFDIVENFKQELYGSEKGAQPKEREKLISELKSLAESILLAEQTEQGRWKKHFFADSANYKAHAASTLPQEMVALVFKVHDIILSSLKKPPVVLYTRNQITFKVPGASRGNIFACLYPQQKSLRIEIAGHETVSISTFEEIAPLAGFTDGIKKAYSTVENKTT